MRILTYPHDLGIGGSQLNAIEIASALRSAGHESIVFGRPGPLVDRIRELGLEFIESPTPRRRPSPAVVSALADLVARRSVDILHGYEWPPILEVLAAARLRGSRAVPVGTVMSMSVAPFIPKTLELIVGTHQIAQVERGKGRTWVSAIDPPVDLSYNDAAAVAGVAEFRAAYGVSADKLTIVCVTRLAEQLKLEGILTAIEVVRHLANGIPVQLVIVGDGPARDVVARAAAVANARNRSVILTGEMTDPRPAYAAADVALGMGGSALRAMAFEKPLVVQGENGFWRLLTPETVDHFRWAGWYGYGRSAASGATVLHEILSDILVDAALRQRLGEYSLEVVRQGHALDRAASLHMEVYAKAVERSGYPGRVELARSAGVFINYKVRARLRRALGRAQVDDFNANPAAKICNEYPQSRRKPGDI